MPPSQDSPFPTLPPFLPLQALRSLDGSARTNTKQSNEQPTPNHQTNDPPKNTREKHIVQNPVYR